jgi:hypothetical protein
VRGGHGTITSGYGRYSSEKMAQEKTLQQKGTKSEENMFRPCIIYLAQFHGNVMPVQSLQLVWTVLRQ